MANPVGGVGETPEDQWNDAEKAYNAAVTARTDDLLFYHSLLEDILNRVNSAGKSISTDQAYQELVQLGGGMIQVTGEKAGIEGATQGLGSVGTNVMNQVTSDLAAMQGSSPSIDSANDFCSGLQNIYNIASAQQALPKTDPKKWMDNSTATSMMQAVGAVWALFGGSVGSPPSPTTVVKTIAQWASSPSGSAGPSQGLENLQQLAGQLGSLSAGFSSMTSVQSGLMQNTMAQVTQMLNVMRGTITSIVSSVMQMIKNQSAG